MNRKRMSLQIPPDLYEEVSRLAEENNRSESSQVVYMLRQAMGVYPQGCADWVELIKMLRRDDSGTGRDSPPSPPLHDRHNS